MNEISFETALSGRVNVMVEACTRCGKCVEVCPSVRPAGIVDASPKDIISGVLDILRTGRGHEASRKWAASCMLKFPPPIWTIIYIVVSATISWLLGWPTPPGLPLPLLGIGLVAVAFIPPVWAIVLFRREGTEVNPTSPANRKLVTNGPYQFTRNPMYLGLVIFALGVALWIGAWPMLVAPVATFATAEWVHIPFEEGKMRRQFGATYEDYVERVRRWV